MNISNIHSKAVCLDVNLWAVLDTLPAYIAVVDRNGVILYLNAAWYQLLLERAVGSEGFNVGNNFIHSFASTFGSGKPHDRAIIQNGMDDVMHGVRDQFTHDYIHYQSGVKHWYTIMIIPTYMTNGTRGVIIQQTDTTTRKQEVEALHAQTSLFQVLSSAAEQFLRAGEFQPTVQQMLRHLGNLIGVHCAFVCRTHLLSECLEVWTMRQGNAEQPYQNGYTAGPSAYANVVEWNNQLRQGVPLYGSVTTFPEEAQPIAALRHTQSLALVPVVGDTHLWGYIGFEDRDKPRIWTDEERDVMQRAASIIGAALYRTANASDLRVHTTFG